MIADETAGGNFKLETGIPVVGSAHVHEDALALGKLADDGAGVLLGDVNVALLNGLELLALFIVLVNNFRLADCKFVALAAHHFDENGEMQLASSGNLEGIGGIRVFDAERDIRVELAVETVAQMTGGYIFALTACERRVVDSELHADGRLTDLLERNRNRILGRADRVADLEVFDTGDSDDGSDGGFLYVYLFKAVEFIELGDADFLDLPWEPGCN